MRKKSKPPKSPVFDADAMKGHAGEGDLRRIALQLVNDITEVIGCLELLEENEAVAKEKLFQIAFRAAKRSGPRALELHGKLLTEIPRSVL